MVGIALEEDTFPCGTAIVLGPFYMEASYTAGRVTRQRRDPGCYLCIKYCFFRLTVYMGQSGITRLAEISAKRADISARRVDIYPM